MKSLHKALLAALPAVLAAGAAILPAGAAIDVRHIRDLPGRWTGDGTVVMRSGEQMPYACIVTYFLEEGGTHLRQNVRCKNKSDHKIDLATQLNVSGERLSGTWEERLTALKGNVKGHVTSNGFEVLAQHSHFQAKFEIAMADGCRQTVRIVPSREVREITAKLRKC